MSSTEASSDDAKLAQYAEALRAGLVTHTGTWVEAIVGARVAPDRLQPIVTALGSEIDRVLTEVAELLDTDIDGQRANPLALMRSLVPPITRALRDERVPVVTRDPDATRLFPDDVFDLTPGAFTDIHPELHLPGLSWGAAKAHVHIQRRRAEGLR